MECRPSAAIRLSILSGASFIWLVALGTLVLGLGPSTPSRAVEASDPPAQITLPTVESCLKRFGYESVSLQRTGENHLLVAATLNDQPHTLLVDTGWSITALDRRVARDFKTLKELGRTTRDPAFSRLPPEYVVPFDKIALGGAEFFDQHADVRDLSSNGRQGVLGADFFLRRTAFIDCGARQLHVRGGKLLDASRASLDACLRQSGYEPCPLRLAPGIVMLCPVQVNGHTVQLLLDTGAHRTVLDIDAASRCALDVADKRTQIRGVGRIGASYLREGAAATFQFGNITRTNLVLGVADVSRWGLAIPKSNLPDVHGMLGMDLLGPAGAIVDYASRQFWLPRAAAP